MSYSNMPPPKCLEGSRATRYKSEREIEEEQQNVEKYNTWSRKPRASTSSRPDGHDSDEEYFNDDDEPQHKISKDGDDDDDELDAFMAEINAQAKNDQLQTQKREEDMQNNGVTTGGGTGRDDIDEEDMQESYFKFMEDYKEKHGGEDEDTYEYDEDGNVTWTWKKVVDPLPPLDHSTMSYPPFEIGFYNEHEEIAALPPMKVFELRNSMEIRVFGINPPKPCVSFAHFGLDDRLISRISNSKFESPTAVQAQAVPTALTGRDVLGLAKTGSGKTLAYVLPALVHVSHQPTKKRQNSPIVLIVVPSRELCLQVYSEVRHYAKALDIEVVSAHGGGSKYEQEKALKSGCEVCVATPGRIIDLIKNKSTDFTRTSFLVFDEADRMFDLGFEAQVKSISDHVRPDRQCLMFSATFPTKIEKLAAQALNNPIKILCGDVGEANADVVQKIEILPTVDAKWTWLYSNIVKFCTEGKVIVFVTKKLDAEVVADRLKQRNVQLVLLHGDMHQIERSERLKSFRNETPCLVATDVAARGLDIPSVRNVINFDVARDLDTHVHRIGRTGRAGHTGYAHTLLTDGDKEFAGPLLHSLSNSGHEVPPALTCLAEKSKWWSEHGATGDKAKARVRTGLGFSETRSPVRNLNTVLSKPDQKKNLDQLMNKAKSVAESSTGLSMSRYDTMRQVLKASYKGTFTKATSEDAPCVQFTDPTPSKAKPDEPPKKTSRWN